jgi:hypothetical protein
VVSVLAGRLHLSAEEIAKLGHDDAETLVRERWQHG